MNINPMNLSRQTGNTKIAELKQLAAEILAVPEGAAIMVTELQCTEPGCPPLETVIAILTGANKNRQYKIHKPACEVRREDILRAVALADAAPTAQEKHT